jgi:hypothetical protein
MRDSSVEITKTCFVLKDVLPDVIARISANNIHEQINFENAWRDIAGPESTGSAYAGFKNGCVFVIVDTPARLYQWKLKKTATLRRLGEICPQVKNVVFKIGKVR